MKKVYEIKNMDSCSLSTVYMGVKVNLTFQGGNAANHVNGKLITSNPFIQDAIEAMPMFGNKIFCSYSYQPKREEQPIQKVEKPRATPVNANAAEARIARAKRAKDVGNVVESVKNVNDAASYFGDKGIVVESPEHLKELMAKHNVVFPNLAE